MAVSPANLIIIQNNYSNLQTLTIELKMALIPNGGKLQTEVPFRGRALERKKRRLQM